MKIVILDTGCANLSSVKYAIQRLGYNPIKRLKLKVTDYLARKECYR